MKWKMFDLLLVYLEFAAIYVDFLRETPKPVFLVVVKHQWRVYLMTLIVTFGEFLPAKVVNLGELKEVVVELTVLPEIFVIQLNY